MKTNTKSRFYALIIQALSIRNHRAVLVELCNCDRAQRSIHDLIAVTRNVVDTVFDIASGKVLWALVLLKLA